MMLVRKSMCLHNNVLPPALQQYRAKNKAYGLRAEGGPSTLQKPDGLVTSRHPYQNAIVPDTLAKAGQYDHGIFHKKLEYRE
jgi:hypothetical protein